MADPAAHRSLPRLATLQERLAYLFKTAQGQKSLRYVEKWIRDYASQDETGQTEAMTYNYLANIARGEQDNPSIKKIRSLAAFFDVKLSWLLGEFDDTDDEQDEVDKPEPPLVAILAAKARGLGERDLRVVEGLVDSLLEPDDRDPPDH